MTSRSETSAGGVVYRRFGAEVKVAIGDQQDRFTKQHTVRLPKGHIEPGETAEEAAVREVSEEIGFRSRVIAELGTAAYTYEADGDAVEKTVHYYLMEWLPGEPSPIDGEMIRVHWRSLDDAEGELTFEPERRAIREARGALEQREIV